MPCSSIRLNECTVIFPWSAQVVLQLLRPFAPMEVVNTRVCSKAAPAPGNVGFDGCQELLSLTCTAHERALTVWDDASFVFIDKTGACSSLQKRTMLHFSLPTLRFLVKNMRSFTVCCGGQTPPGEVARAVIRSAGWGAKKVSPGIGRECENCVPVSALLATFYLFRAVCCEPSPLFVFPVNASPVACFSVDYRMPRCYYRRTRRRLLSRRAAPDAGVGCFFLYHALEGLVFTRPLSFFPYLPPGDSLSLAPYPRSCRLG